MTKFVLLIVFKAKNEQKIKKNCLCDTVNIKGKRDINAGHPQNTCMTLNVMYSVILLWLLGWLQTSAVWLNLIQLCKFFWFPAFDLRTANWKKAIVLQSTISICNWQEHLVWWVYAKHFVTVIHVFSSSKTVMKMECSKNTLQGLWVLNNESVQLSVFWCGIGFALVKLVWVWNWW